MNCIPPSLLGELNTEYRPFFIQITEISSKKLANTEYRHIVRTPLYTQAHSVITLLILSDNNPCPTPKRLRCSSAAYVNLYPCLSSQPLLSPLLILKELNLLTVTKRSNDI